MSLRPCVEECHDPYSHECGSESPFFLCRESPVESFFAIPGMGSYMIDAIQRQDFAVVQAMVSLGSFLYVVGLLMTDISYTLVDPRVRLE